MLFSSRRSAWARPTATVDFAWLSRAGEIGQIRIQPDGPSLNGAVDGSLEALASGRALADEIERAAPTDDTRGHVRESSIAR